jgi:hypothetical protein
LHAVRPQIGGSRDKDIGATVDGRLDEHIISVVATPHVEAANRNDLGIVREHLHEIDHKGGR